MPFCPRCRGEYRPGFTRCIDCDLPLVDPLPPERPRARGQPVQEVQVATFKNEAEAMLWSELLRREGIPAVIVPLGPGAGAWGTSALLPHALRVRAEDAESARELLAGQRE